MYSCFLKRVIDFIIAFCVLAAIFPHIASSDYFPSFC